MTRAIACVMVCLLFLCSCAKPGKATANSTDFGQMKAMPEAVAGNPDFTLEATASPVVQPAQNDSSSVPRVRAQDPVLELPSEALVIQAGDLSVGKVDGLIKSEKFDAFVSRLSAESEKNPLAQDVTEMESKNLEEFFGNKARLRNFACGTSVCAGTVAMGKDPSIYKKFSDDFLAHGPANASLLDYPVKLDNGELEQRFVMSVDPNIKGITIPVHP